MRILNIHYADRENAGDVSCRVSKWFGFRGHEWVVADIHDAKTVGVSDFRAVVIGGGGLINEEWVPEIEWVAARNPNTILWGVGTNSIRGEIRWPRNVPSAHVFSRDLVPSWCPSMMHPAFDGSESRSGAGLGYVFGSALRPYPSFDLPSGAESINTERTQDEILSFIGGKSCIATNSYHAALWSWALGKSVAIVRPANTKFDSICAAACGSIQVWDDWVPDSIVMAAIRNPTRFALIRPHGCERLMSTMLDQ